MPESLPSGWIRTTLGNIAQPSRSRVSPNESGTLRYVGLEHIEPHSMKLLRFEQAHRTRSSSLCFSKGDVLYGRMRPYLNKVWVAEFSGICSSEFIVFPKHRWLNNRFFAARLNADDFVQYADERVSGDRPRVSYQQLRDFELLLPPLAEQHRIVAKLDAAMTRWRAGVTAAKRAQIRIEHYRHAVLQSAVEGKLTKSWRLHHKDQQQETSNQLLVRILESRQRKWRDMKINRPHANAGPPKIPRMTLRYKAPTSPHVENENAIPKEWTWTSISQLSWHAGYGTSTKCSYDFDGVPVLRIPNVRGRCLKFNDIKFARPAEFPASAFVQPGDMLLIRTNGNKNIIGRAAIVSEPLDSNYAFASYLIRYRLLGAATLWSWVELAWDSDLSRLQIEQRAKTTAGQYNLSLSALADTPIPLPPLEEQEIVVQEVRRRLNAANNLWQRVTEQIVTADEARKKILRDAFAGQLVEQDSDEQHADSLIAGFQDYLRVLATRPKRKKTQQQRVGAMSQKKSLMDAWSQMNYALDARRLFDEAGFGPPDVIQFYEELRNTVELCTAFQQDEPPIIGEDSAIEDAFMDREDLLGRFRLRTLWLDDFKNLRDFLIEFDLDRPLHVILGWNGTGKSNLFEALVVLFRDLHEWTERNRWPDVPMTGFKIEYELGEFMFRVDWDPESMKRPRILRALKEDVFEQAFEPVRRQDLELPKFIFGYYAGPTNRMAEHFLPMKQAHYDRLREATVDDESTLADLLERRRFFCAETHHAKYVLLAFLYRQEPDLRRFLDERLRIVGFESALFVVRKPRWAKANSDASEFWGATGIMRRIMERLRHHAVAPMVLEQRVNYGYRSTTEDHYYFFLPDVNSLRAFAAEYADARTFFLALESTDFSELIHDVNIQVRIRAEEEEDSAITFRQLSEGEQQLLMVLGLMRFTQSKQSLVLLDEPDTHLNPHWSANYLKDLNRVMSTRVEGSVEQESSQLLIATHDPLVIGGLVRDQIHLLVRDSGTGKCTSVVSTVNPRGLGVSGILTSEMFGFRSDLDEGTLADLDARVRLVGQERALTQVEENELKEIDDRLTDAGFTRAFSDPYYSAFLRAWSWKQREQRERHGPIPLDEQEMVDRVAREVLTEVLQEIHGESNT